MNTMFASRALTFILVTGVVFGIAAAITSWANGASVLWVVLSYMFGGNIGLSLGAALVFAHNSRHSND